jgi:uncharacterized coiled-coil DUF342 family protein
MLSPHRLVEMKQLAQLSVARDLEVTLVDVDELLEIIDLAEERESEFDDLQNQIDSLQNENYDLREEVRELENEIRALALDVSGEADNDDTEN